MKSLFIVIISCICLPLIAQQSRITYNGLTNSKEAVPIHFKYRYPQFLSGEVHYKDGHGGRGRLNYNMLVQEIHFIDEKGDTMALENLETVRLITMGQDSFYFNKSIIEIAGRYNDVLLGVKYRLSVKDRQKIGAYGMANPGGSIDTYDAVRAGRGTYQLGINENITLGKEQDYVLILRDKIFLPLNWNNIAKAFPSKKEKLEQYATQNRVNLKNQEDVLKVLAYCVEN